MLICGIVKEMLIFPSLIISEPMLCLEGLEGLVSTLATWAIKNISSFLLSIVNGFGIKYINSYYNLRSMLPGDKEKYLSPTMFCESEDPSIVAMSNRLGAYEKPKIEYVNDCFEWVQDNIKFRMTTMGSGAKDALIMGHGNACGDIGSLFIALCRAGGVRARYRIYPIGIGKRDYVPLKTGKGGWQRYKNALEGELMGYISSEIWMDGTWMSAEPMFTREYAAGLNVPVPKLGEDASSWSYAHKTSKSITYDSLPLLYYLETKANNLMICKIADRANHDMIWAERKGRKILNKMGEKEYNRKLKERYEYMGPTIKV